MRVLVLNPGSSTLKAAVVSNGAVIGGGLDTEWRPGDTDASTVVGGAIERVGDDADAVGYRVVHGGAAYRSAAVVDEALLAAVEELDRLAPLHNRRAASVMRTAMAALPALPHVACFDTAFHAGLPEEAWRYPLPADWVERWGIRRFGFHGLSVAWATQRTAALLDRNVQESHLIVAHLGSGCSITAVDRGRSVDTSMGFTPHEGVMMGTRSGSIDPGILLELLYDGVGANELTDGLAHRSGLQAIAGTSNARDIERRAGGGDDVARLALAMFTRRVAAAVAAAATALPALDALVFTGGIGDHSVAVRDDVVRRLWALGVPTTLRQIHGGDAILADGPPAVLAIETREELVIAREVEALLT